MIWLSDVKGAILLSYVIEILPVTFTIGTNFKLISTEKWKGGSVTEMALPFYHGVT